ncbi:MAG: transcriptional regulator GcvA [Gammaproteobacteria bacterium]|nr:transcriptional regulator GcvA [Gammaproteobacteria bacterium]MCY4218111.1 transcriptional regulator GcvA [Gammaproteobacteria bacterium]MCY4274829.1 transcriptional regulator GcvA [Gammaproteobacteria bacterium]
MDFFTSHLIPYGKVVRLIKRSELLSWRAIIICVLFEMAIRIPPTSALRALEASARHLNFTLAAEELYVTQSAVSHQIRHLEELWGVQLFKRKGRSLILTEAGHEIVPIIRDFIRKLTTTIESITSNYESENTLKVTLLESFAFKWFVPRLGHFNSVCPEVNVWISTTDDLTDFTTGDADVGIRLGYGNWENLYQEILLQEYIMPVCSPRFLEKYGVPNEPKDLLRYPLLRRYTRDILQRWKDWFSDAGIEVDTIPEGTHFPQTSLALQAAIDDQGVALARSAHVLDDLTAGRLVNMFPEVRSKSKLAYYIVCLSGRENHPVITSFRNWIQQEASKSRNEFNKLFD